MIIPVEHFLTVSASLFVIGVFGIFLNRKNVIIILMSIELILASVNINFVVFSVIFRRPSRTSLCNVCFDSGSRRSSNWFGNTCLFLQITKLYFHRRCKYNEGLNID